MTSQHPIPSATLPARAGSGLALLTLLLALAAAPLAAQATDAAGAAATAASASVADPAYADALAVFNQALAGKESAVTDAVAQWRSLMTAHPTDPVARAYAGAATSMQARTTMLPWKKMGYVDDGMALLDKALAQLTPAHDQQRVNGVAASLHVRFTAASTFNALPAMLNRGDRGARLMDELLKNPLLASAPLAFRGTVWLRAADDAAKAQRPADEREWLQRLVASGAPQASIAQSRLKGL
jgi:hypothetical protein